MSDIVHVYVDAAREKETRVLNRFGKLATVQTGRWQIGVVCGERRAMFFNARIEDLWLGDVLSSYDAEAWAHLKGYEIAIEESPFATTVVIHSDALVTFDRAKGSLGRRYMDLLSRLAADRGVSVKLARIEGAMNVADEVSRFQGDGVVSAAPPKAPRSDFAAQMAAKAAARDKAMADPVVAARVAQLEAKVAAASGTRRRTIKQNLRDVIAAANDGVTVEDIRARRAAWRSGATLSNDEGRSGDAP